MSQLTVPLPATPHSASAPGPSIAAYVLRPWPLYLALPVLAAALFLAAAVLGRAEYTVVASFVTEARAESGRNAGALGGLASQLGLGTSSGALSPQYTVQVLTSQAILLDIADVRVPRSTGDSVRLRELLGVNAPNQLRADEKALEQLRRAVRATVNPRTGIVDLQVTLPDPVSAQYTAGLLVRRLNDFNVARQRGQAGRRREFAETLLHDARDSLAGSERSLRVFLEQNRVYQGSPLLTIEYERLQRQVSAYAALYASLRGEFETARMDEVNDVPVITMIDPPRIPARPSNGNMAIAVASGLAVGGLLALLAATIRAYAWRALQGGPGGFIAGVGRRSRLVARLLR